MNRAALVALSLALACVHGENVGRNATSGFMRAIEQRRAEQGDAEPFTTFTIGRSTARGAMEGLLGQPLPDDQKRQLDALIRDLTAGGLRSLTGAGGGTPYAAILARQAAASFASEFEARLLRDLGEHGEGPLAQAIAGTTANTAASALRVVADQAGAFYPECAGAGRQKCIQSQLELLGQSAATGFARGIWRGMPLLPIVLGFIGGLIFAVMFALMASLLRAKRGGELPLTRRRTA